MHYVFLTNSVVTDQCQPDPYTVFFPEYASQFIEAADEVTFGWTYEGGVFVPPILEIAPDQEILMRQSMVVSKFQGKAALLQAGLLTDVEALVADPLTDPLVVLAWSDVTEFRRLSPMIAGIASALGWSDEQLDGLFEAAAQISA